VTWFHIRSIKNVEREKRRKPIVRRTERRARRRMKSLSGLAVSLKKGGISGRILNGNMKMEG
jgi:hypothetical protein